MSKQISVSDDVHDELKALKLCDGDSFNSVVKRLLDTVGGVTE